jgi:hypothetical protein
MGGLKNGRYSTWVKQKKTLSGGTVHGSREVQYIDLGRYNTWVKQKKSNIISVL